MYPNLDELSQLSCCKTKLNKYIQKYNKSDNDSIAQIYYMQKIVYAINKLHKMDQAFYEWYKDKWLKHLQNCGVNPYGSFFIKAFQFAELTTKLVNTEHNQSKKHVVQDQIQLLQELNSLLGEDAFDEEKYKAVNCSLTALATTNEKIKTKIKKEMELLALFEEKIEAIIWDQTPTNQSYSTQLLGEPNNNYIFRLDIENHNTPYIIHVEDVKRLDLYQDLEMSKAAHYLNEDIALFIMEFSKNTGEIESKPVIFSPFCRQGDLSDVAKSLVDEKQYSIPSITVHYFKLISDFCNKLMESGIYHPDIKLKNFLVHNNRIVIGDKKALVKSMEPKINEIRSTPIYAPDEFLEALNKDLSFNKEGEKTVNMPQFMSFQLGMALREFLLLSHGVTISDEIRDLNKRTISYFTGPDNKITNLCILVDELTKRTPNERLSIEAFYLLLYFFTNPPEEFKKKLSQLATQSKSEITSSTTPVQGNSFETINTELVPFFENLPSKLESSLSKTHNTQQITRQELGSSNRLSSSIIFATTQINSQSSIEEVHEKENREELWNKIENNATIERPQNSSPIKNCKSIRSTIYRGDNYIPPKNKMFSKPQNEEQYSIRFAPLSKENNQKLHKSRHTGLFSCKLSNVLAYNNKSSHEDETSKEEFNAYNYLLIGSAVLYTAGIATMLTGFIALLIGSNPFGIPLIIVGAILIGAGGLLFGPNESFLDEKRLHPMCI